MSVLKSYTFGGDEKGQNLLVLGAVHGNEPCGTKAIQKTLDSLNNKDLKIEKGSVTFIPICNPKAYEQNTRFYESNLNRHLYPKNTPESYEDHLANELCEYLKQADLLLDLHSYRRGGPAFGFISPAQNSTELKLIDACNLPYAVYGFAESYKAANIDIDENAAMGTREYFLTQGGVGITVECGQHDDPESINVAHQAIKGVLTNFGFTDSEDSKNKNTAKFIEMKHVIFKEKEGTLIKLWENFEPVKKGDILATYTDGSNVPSPSDGVIVMPDVRADMPAEEEWLYIGAVQ